MIWATFRDPTFPGCRSVGFVAWAHRDDQASLWAAVLGLRFVEPTHGPLTVRMFIVTSGRLLYLPESLSAPDQAVQVRINGEPQKRFLKSKGSAAAAEPLRLRHRHGGRGRCRGGGPGGRRRRRTTGTTRNNQCQTSKTTQTRTIHEHCWNVC